MNQNEKIYADYKTMCEFYTKDHTNYFLKCCDKYTDLEAEYLENRTKVKIPPLARNKLYVNCVERELENVILKTFDLWNDLLENKGDQIFKFTLYTYTETQMLENIKERYEVEHNES